MYKLKKIGKLFTSKFVGNLPGRGFTKVEKHCLKPLLIKLWVAKQFRGSTCYSYFF